MFETGSKIFVTQKVAEAFRFVIGGVCKFLFGAEDNFLVMEPVEIFSHRRCQRISCHQDGGRWRKHQEVNHKNRDNQVLGAAEKVVRMSEPAKDVLESEKQKVIQSLEEDDEFEDFQAEDWQDGQAMGTESEKALWVEDWDDNDVDDNFSKDLK
jgi:26 proteasome complex subunit DSS1